MVDLQPFIDKIKETLALSAVLSRFIKVKRHGHEFQAICPFHSEKTPSFTINDHKGFYYCFGCGASGDGVRFLMDHQKLPFLEAVKQLAAMAGMAMPKLESTGTNAHGYAENDRLYKLLEAATVFFEKTLVSTSFAQTYLNQRQLDQNTIKAYRIGFATNAVIDHLQKQGFTPSEMAGAGISIAKDKPLSRFRDRLIFPICDHQGRVIAFGGRAMGEGQQPKYLNSPETTLFHKSIHLYGLNHIKGVNETNPLVVVEGYVDVIRAQINGFNAVAPLGTALTIDHIQRLWRMHKEPILCFDGDLAGEKAMVRGAFKALPILKPGYSLRFCPLPQKHDPDSFLVEKGKDSFYKILLHSHSLQEVLFLSYEKQIAHGTPEQKAKIKSDFLKEIDSITDSHIKGFYKDAFYKRQRTSKTIHAPSEPFVPTLKWSREISEKILLATLLHHPTLVSVMAEQLTCVQWTTPEANSFTQALLKEHDENDSSTSNELLQNYASFIRMLKSDEIGALAPFSRETADIEAAEKGFLDVFHQLVTKNQLLQTLAEVKKQLTERFDQNTWQMFQQLKRELQSL